MNRKRRSLVLTSESARHPFRMALPASAQGTQGDDDWSDAPTPRKHWRDMFNTYVATLVVMTVFLA